jgi:hypothetical protein
MMNDRMNNRNKVVLVTGAGWPMTANGAKRPFLRRKMAQRLGAQRAHGMGQWLVARTVGSHVLE